MIELIHKWYNNPGLTQYRNVQIIEDYIGNNMGINDLSVKYDLDFRTISYILNKYFKKPDRNLTLSSKI